MNYHFEEKMSTIFFIYNLLTWTGFLAFLTCWLLERRARKALEKFVSDKFDNEMKELKILCFKRMDENYQKIRQEFDLKVVKINQP